MLTQSLTAAVATRLCREAERLELVWEDPDLDPGFVTDQILAVLRFLEKVGCERRSAAAQAEFATALLHEFCRRNGRRDTARARQGRACGTRPLFLSLDALRETGWDALGAHPQSAWLEAEIQEEDANGLPLALARFLEGRGWARERAWMFLWAEYYGLEWKAVAQLMAERFEVQASSAALRKWAERNWAAVRVDAADFWARRQAGEDVTNRDVPGIPNTK